MANSYIKTAFDLAASSEELDLLEEAMKAFDASVDDQPFAPSRRLAETLGTPDATDAAALFGPVIETPAAGLDLTVRRESETLLSISGTQHASVEDVAQLIRLCCPSALPFAFSFCVDQDKPNANGYGGGYVTITAAGVGGINVDLEAHSIVRRLRADQPLDQLMKDAIEAYDDDGLLWDNVRNATYEEAKRIIVEEPNDTLSLFILTEMHDAKGDYEEGARMLETAAEQLQRLADSLRAKSEAAASAA